MDPRQHLTASSTATQHTRLRPTYRSEPSFRVFSREPQALQAALSRLLSGKWSDHEATKAYLRQAFDEVTQPHRLERELLAWIDVQGDFLRTQGQEADCSGLGHDYNVAHAKSLVQLAALECRVARQRDHGSWRSDRVEPQRHQVILSPAHAMQAPLVTHDGLAPPQWGQLEAARRSSDLLPAGHGHPPRALPSPRPVTPAVSAVRPQAWTEKMPFAALAQALICPLTKKAYTEPMLLSAAGLVVDRQIIQRRPALERRMPCTDQLMARLVGVWQQRDVLGEDACRRQVQALLRCPKSGQPLYRNWLASDGNTYHPAYLQHALASHQPSLLAHDEELHLAVGGFHARVSWLAEAWSSRASLEELRPMPLGRYDKEARLFGSLKRRLAAGDAVEWFDEKRPLAGGQERIEALDLPSDATTNLAADFTRLLAIEDVMQACVSALEEDAVHHRVNVETLFTLIDALIWRFLFSNNHGDAHFFGTFVSPVLKYVGGDEAHMRRVALQCLDKDPIEDYDRLLPVMLAQKDAHLRKTICLAAVVGRGARGMQDILRTPWRMIMLLSPDERARSVMVRRTLALHGGVA